MMLGRLVRSAGMVLGVLAFTAPVASGAIFDASRTGHPTGPFTTRGGSGTAGQQEFSLPPFHVKCDRARATGSIENEDRFFLDTLKFSSCAASVQLTNGSHLSVPARFEAPLQLAYFAPTGAAVILAPNTIDIKPLGCTITMEEGGLFERLGGTGGATEGAGGGHPTEPPFTGLLAPTLKLRPFPTGEQHKLTIDNNQLGIHFVFGGACEALEPTALGSYSGTTFDEVVGGNLEYDPTGVRVQTQEEEVEERKEIEEREKEWDLNENQEKTS
jgi:hypothetical protein